MKKYSFLLLSLLLVSCNNNNPSSSSSQINKAPEETEIELISATKDFSYVRKDFVVKKDGKVFYENYQIITYDDYNSYQSVYTRITSISSLDDDKSAINESSTIYYDGAYSYTLKSDNMYYKDACDLKIKAYELAFDFTKLTNTKLETKEFENELTGVVNQEDITSFYGKSLENVTSINVKTISDKTKLTNLNLSYSQDGYDITYSFILDTSSKTVTLPTSEYIK